MIPHQSRTRTFSLPRLTTNTLPANATPDISTLPSTNSTTALNLTAYPIGNSIQPAGCPSVDNDLYLDNTTVVTPQTFQVQCYRSFSSPNYQELQELHFNACIAACDNINGGGSAINGGTVGLFCYGVTWFKVGGYRCADLFTIRFYSSCRLFGYSGITIELSFSLPSLLKKTTPS
jgi:hypothetical protein